jgi:hypothetical protein
LFGFRHSDRHAALILVLIIAKEGIDALKLAEILADLLTPRFDHRGDQYVEIAASFCRLTISWIRLIFLLEHAEESRCNSIYSDHFRSGLRWSLRMYGREQPTATFVLQTGKR